MNLSSTGYGPGRYQRLLFSGEEEDYEIWETKFLGYLRTRNLKKIILSEPPTEPAEELAAYTLKNEECYAELVQFLDDKSLGLVMREADNDGRQALNMLREHYASSSKPKIVSLYMQLINLEMERGETVTSYFIRAEKLLSALQRAKEAPGEKLLISILLKGLPTKFKPFSIHVTQSNEDISLSAFKVALKNFEETEKLNSEENQEDQIMKASVSSQKACYGCGSTSHLIKDYNGNNIKCKYHKGASHLEKDCYRHKTGKDKFKLAVEKEMEDAFVQESDEENHTFNFVSATESRPKREGLIVDTGATSHIVNKDILINCDRNFEPTKHCIELADGTKMYGCAIKRGDARVTLVDNQGKHVEAILRGALYIPSYPQSLFSVKAATMNSEAEIRFTKDGSWMKKDGTTFNIELVNSLYYLETCENQDKVSLSIDYWHRVLGHCNYDDITKLEGVVVGMKIDNRQPREGHPTCETCIQGKFTNTRSRNPDKRATSPLELVHTDLAGPIHPVAKDGFKYAISFTDDYSGFIFAYFLRNKSDTLVATKKFLADCSPIGQVKRLRCDNGGEFSSHKFVSLMRDSGIKQEFSSPDSPHQNGTAERFWRTLFEMARCLLIESNLPKNLWTYAVRTAAFVRNRCFNARLEKTPFEALTGVKPNLSKMYIFGSPCYAFIPQSKKLDPKGKQGIFIGYDAKSPAYLVYHPDSGKVQRVRLIKIVDRPTVNQQTQTPVGDEVETPNSEVEPLEVYRGECTPPDHEQEELDNANENAENQQTTGRYPQRNRVAPSYLKDYETEVDMVNSAFIAEARYEKAPIAYTEAIASENSDKWVTAMDSEMNALRENETFTIMKLPEGKNVVGGEWVYNIKHPAQGKQTFKARYVAKGFSQVQGIDYFETFAPTASMTSVRLVVQIAAQQGLIIHQMDVSTAYLNAEIDTEIYIRQPEGYEMKSEDGTELVWKLNKSLYGLKQSGRNWNQLLHEHLIREGFQRNPADHCVYHKRIGNELIIVLVWVDDILIAASNLRVMNEFKDSMKEKFNMKDLMEISCFLGIDFEQKEGEISMNQSRYIMKVLEKFSMVECKPRSTPCEVKIGDVNHREKADPNRFREMVGSLIYLAMGTRPDIAWVVSRLSQNLAEPQTEDLVTAKHVLRYLKGTIDYKLTYRKTFNSEQLRLMAYSDSDWGASEDRKSTTGYCFSLSEGSAPVSWKAKKQPTVALSTCEAEYMALGATTQEALYLLQLANAILSEKLTCAYIKGDNQGAIALCKNPVHRQRSKHIDIKYHFIRSILNEGKIDIKYCPTEEMVADVFTKPATKAKLSKHRKYLFGN